MTRTPDLFLERVDNRARDVFRPAEEIERLGGGRGNQQAAPEQERDDETREREAGHIGRMRTLDLDSSMVSRAPRSNASPWVRMILMTTEPRCSGDTSCVRT